MQLIARPCVSCLSGSLKGTGEIGRWAAVGRCKPGSWSTRNQTPTFSLGAGELLPIPVEWEHEPIPARMCKTASTSIVGD